MNTWKQKSRLTQANLTSEPSANMAQEQSPMVRYLQEAAAGEQSCTLDLDKQMRSRMERQFGAPAGALIEKLERQSGVGLDDVEIHRDSPRPAQIGALAYAHGSQVYLGPGQERYLGHELTHVVQQKQGLVRPTGAVDGLPLNTSPALERAADAMAVTFAPASAVPGPDVVQGVLVHPDGTELSDEDIDALKKLAQESMTAMIQQLIAYNDHFGPAGEGIPENESEAITNALTSAQNNLDKHFDDHEVAAKRYSAAKILGEYMEQAFAPLYPQAPNFFGKVLTFIKKTTGDMPQTHDDVPQAHSRIFNAFMQMNYQPPAAFKAVGEKPPQGNSGDKIQKLLDSFRLPSSVAKGIDKIRTSGSDQAMANLEEARISNSVTLNEQAEKIPQFRQGAEVAQNGANDLRNMSADQINFHTLTKIFFQINAAVRNGEGDAGKLRGHYIQAGNIVGPGAFALPEQTYRTFFALAKQLRQIKATTDPNLVKTQAAHLAAFAYQMTISEHLFSDGNGRTCRLFSDTILQAFDLPPAAPVEALGQAGKNLSEENLNFTTGNIAFVQGLRRSHNILRGIPLQNMDADPQPPEVPDAVPGGMGLSARNAPVYIEAALAGIGNELKDYEDESAGLADKPSDFEKELEQKEEEEQAEGF